MLDELNQSLKSPAIVSKQGGITGWRLHTHGGQRADLTVVGEQIVWFYRDLQLFRKN
ncbi:unnamed protein product (plasmid) [Mycetohabitans rhizoxinica HKI 454]|uniref:Uncharacterized protein n=1 Tax=Mycetohabitans rhizoxinica (strain DSM 19002 / CIP 109453 / HKI 454) TaxID=882378 RepID=E5AUB9_MYCRK|nr:unnamed protein product [Mycetohabitans rhizoxinica HKI 454]